MTKSVSIVISVYNAEDTISACLKSLVSQTRNAEIIVVDDGSKDHTIARVKAFKHVVLIEMGHHGPAIARNRGVKTSRGDILVFVDADMTFTPDFIEKLVSPIEAGQTKGTWTKEELVANWDKPLAQAWNLEYTSGRFRSRIPERAPNASQVFRAIIRSEFERVNGFDSTGYTDDWTLSAKLGYQATVAPGAVMYHKNPDTLAKIFAQATWIAKRQYKLGEIGRGLALIRASFPVSLIVGASRSIRFKLPIYFVFKLWFDLGISVGIISFWIEGKNAK